MFNANIPDDILKQYGQNNDFGFSVVDSGELNSILSPIGDSDEIKAIKEKLDQILELKSKFGVRVNYSTLKNPISHGELVDIFASSRIYIGCSVSDGISTSFLEAMTKGVYPVQTNTSCAGEWIDKGAVASLIDLDVWQLNEAIDLAITDNKLVDFAAEKNLQVAKRFLTKAKIAPIAQQFYSWH